MKKFITFFSLCALMCCTAVLNAQDGIYLTHEDFVNKKMIEATYDGVSHGPGYVIISFKIAGKRKDYNVNKMFMFTRGNSIYRSAPTKRGGTQLVILEAVAGYCVWHQAMQSDGNSALSTYLSKTIDGELTHIPSLKELEQLAAGNPEYKFLLSCMRTKKVDTFSHAFSVAIDQCVKNDPANINKQEKKKEGK